MRGVLAGALVALFSIGPAMSESLMSAAETAKFAAYRKSESFQKRRFEAALAAKQAIAPTACDGRQQIKLVFRGPYVPVRFKKGATEPKEGAWSERLQYVNCPMVPPINLVVVARDGKPVEIFRSVPGHTIADPFLAEQVSTPLASKASTDGKKQNCKTPPTMKSSTLISRPDKEGRWAERWTVDLCGKTKAYRIDFRPKPGGGTAFAIGALGAKAK